MVSRFVDLQKTKHTFHWRVGGWHYTRAGAVINFRAGPLWYRRVGSSWIVEWNWP